VPQANEVSHRLPHSSPVVHSDEIKRQVGRPVIYKHHTCSRALHAQQSVLGLREAGTPDHDASNSFGLKAVQCLDLRMHPVRRWSRGGQVGVEDQEAAAWPDSP